MLDDADEAATAILELYRDRDYALARLSRETVVQLTDSLGPLSRDPDAREMLPRIFGLGALPARRYHASLPTLTVPALLSLDHCWALWLWSRYLPLIRSRDGTPLLIHFDAHDDLSSPPLTVGADGEGLSAPTRDLDVDLRSPDTVARAVERGFIGIGSFIAPLLHCLAACDIVHIVRADGLSRSVVRESLLMTRQLVSGPLGAQPRLGITRTDSATSSPYSYTLTNDIRYLAELGPHGPVLLDIDLDYFSNAFDDRAAPDHSERPTTGIDEILTEIGRMKNSFVHDRLWTQIVCVSIAVSPGFFPTRHLPETLANLVAALGMLRTE